ncbi:PaaI family thioesterase [Nocardia sp. NPDC049149]|uniref:PaaI family thioesterase n=1 Tax=Nocardia sp. NPDC049149 TaxID=3364315 RepID=UPI00371FCCAD
MTDIASDDVTSRDRHAATLPPHHDHCYVCGPHNPASTGVSFRHIDDRLVGAVTLDQRHQGVPGLAHGGAIAALLDETAGSLLIQHGLRFVTARLDVEYVAPVHIGVPLTLTAHLDKQEGRKHTVLTELRDGDTLLAVGRALFVTVSPEHFSARGIRDDAFPAFHA